MYRSRWYATTAAAAPLLPPSVMAAVMADTAAAAPTVGAAPGSPVRTKLKRKGSTMNMAKHLGEEMRMHATESTDFMNYDEHTPIPTVDDFALSERQIVTKLESLGGPHTCTDPPPVPQTHHRLI